MKKRTLVIILAIFVAVIIMSFKIKIKNNNKSVHQIESQICSCLEQIMDGNVGYWTEENLWSNVALLRKLTGKTSQEIFGQCYISGLRRSMEEDMEKAIKQKSIEEYWEEYEYEVEQAKKAGTTIDKI